MCVCSVMSDSLQPHSLPGSSVHGIFQARILEGVAICSSRDLPDPGIKPTFLAPPTLAGGFYANVPPGNPTEIFQCITTKTKKSGVE